MLKYVLLFGFVFAKINTVSAQYVQDINGRVFQLKSIPDVDGSPFLNDEWLAGIVKLANGTVYSDIYLKYNELNGQIYFKGKNTDDLFEFVDPVKEFIIKSPVFNKRFINNSSVYKNDHPFYEMLADGTIKLLKQVVKEVKETRQYDGNTQKKIVATNKYYLLKDGQLVAVNNSKKAILTALGSKQPAIEAFIKTTNIDFKADTDLAKVIIYYNSL